MLHYDDLQRDLAAQVLAQNGTDGQQYQTGSSPSGASVWQLGIYTPGRLNRLQSITSETP
jgi:hypothetical protein